MTIHSHVFPNGLTLLAEPMPWLESASFALLMPAGCVHDPAERAGLASLVAEMAQRGCGTRDSRQFLEQLERLGVDASSSVAGAHTSFGGAMPAESLAPALAIYADLARHPHLPADQLEEARMSCIQEVMAMQDDLATLSLHRLKARQYPDPWGRSSQGTIESLEAASIDDIRGFFETAYVPTHAILSVAGKFTWPELRDTVAQSWADWKFREPPALTLIEAARGYEHMTHESAQTQIWLAYDSIPYSHPDYYQARAAIGVLSDGMSSRLFTEVRENRGLCYSVSAFCHSLRDRGAVFGYAGTTTERAQETLDVMLGEFRKLAAGITDAELSRLKAGLKSALIMQQESSAARAGAMASDWYHLGRVQTLEELGTIVDQLNAPRINAYLAEHPPRDFTLVTLGERPLEISHS